VSHAHQSTLPHAARPVSPLQLNALTILRATAIATVTPSAVVGEVDEDADAELNLDEITAEPLKPVVH
jgi:hypothetical protein